MTTEKAKVQVATLRFRGHNHERNRAFPKERSKGYVTFTINQVAAAMEMTAGSNMSKQRQERPEVSQTRKANAFTSNDMETASTETNANSVIPLQTHLLQTMNSLRE